MSRSLAVDENYEAIIERGGEELHNLLGAPYGIINEPISVKAKYRKIINIVPKVMEFVKPNSPCRKGCSACCNIATAVSGYEATRIAAFIGKAHEPVAPLDFNVDPHAAMQRQQDMVDKYTRVPCTFLDQETHACTIYPVRPMACRTYHSIERDSSQCELGLAGVRYKEVASINMTAFWMAQAELFMETRSGTMADIREFFPDGWGKK